MVSQATKYNNKWVCGNLAKRPTAFVSDWKVEAVTLYHAKVIGSLPF
jgi:hypothetical protein